MATPAQESIQRRHADASQHESGALRETSSRRLSARPRYLYDALGEVRVERLRLARQWQEAGAVHQAIAAYTDMMACYSGMPADAAAAEELLVMAHGLEQQGRFYTVLDILRKVDGIC